MVRTREKAAKGDSAFEKKKQKVGRKKLAPSTATKAEVHARSLRVDVQRAIAVEQERQKTAAKEDAVQDAGPSPAEAAEGPDLPRMIAEAAAGIVHYRAASRRSALQSCLKWLQHRETRFGLVAPARVIQVLEKALTCLVDTDDGVREAATAAIRFILSKTFAQGTGMVPPVAPSILRQLLIALTHAEKGSRTGALDLLGHVLVDAEAWLLEGVPDAQADACFVRHIVTRHPELHDEVLQMLEAAVPVAKATKRFGPLSALLRAIVAPGHDSGAGAAADLVRNPRVAAVFEDVATHAAPLFKELMELRNGLFGVREKFALAVNLAHCVGTLLQAFERCYDALPAAKSTLVMVRSAFVEGVPFTIKDLCGRGSLNGLRIVVAMVSVAMPLLRSGTATAARCVGAAAEGLFESGSEAVLGVATDAVSALITCRLRSDPDTRASCRASAVRLLPRVPAAIGLVLRKATAERAYRCASQAVACVAAMRVALDAGMWDQAAAAATDGASSNVGVELVKALFMARDTAVGPADRDRVVGAAAALLLDAVTDPRHAVAASVRAGIASAAPSLFGIPGPGGATISGIAADAAPEVRLRVAAMLTFAGATDAATSAMPSGDPRFAAAAQLIACAAA
uniref:Pre-rRNA-processing protein Ipi1 N-terminal domain-containing protein n=1 Tax=Neobodo designis TaxID=312471 RepID=A0A7S1R047_NEODS|eukprot:CAMPEP_0174833842 /NCGR_PEP_ID=MMETSP1114-20130205/4479_1 /TAXON_ID=312471 /ORGANISM="Neobodo designis, Strain CCAP 1951/1" /LENGTH=626 /DNA_ID=CAMNT_0016067739 /DNA_START=37 /DNA_END=1917 /DNA_ORIENTATION=-